MAPRERRDILDATEHSFDELIAANLKGPYFLTQAIARDMIAENIRRAHRLSFHFRLYCFREPR